MKPTFGISHRTAVNYMELAEWRDRIEANAQRFGSAALLSVRAAKRVLTALKREDESDKQLEKTATNLVEERERLAEQGEDPDEPVNEDADGPLDSDGNPRTGDDPVYVQRAVNSMIEGACGYADAMTKAQKRAFFITITAAWLPQCDPDTVARCIFKAWSLDDVEKLIGGLQRMRDGDEFDKALGDQPQPTAH